jgi:hypothetical protein
MTTQVTNDMIADGAVTTVKIADANVTTAKMADANVTPAKLSQPLTLGTAQATTSGTSIDFTSIPSWVKRITIALSGVSTNGSANLIVQIGAGSVTTTGYAGTGATVQGGVTGFAALQTNGFCVSNVTLATTIFNGVATLVSMGNNTWAFSSITGRSDGASLQMGGGAVALSGTLDRVRLTTANGSDAFDAGSVNILYE